MVVEPNTEPRDKRSGAELGALIVAIVLPSVVTLAYFRLVDGAPGGWQQAVYAVGKTVQFALPVVWVGLVCRERLGWNGWRWKGVGVGVLFGGAVFAANWLLYLGMLRDAAFFAPAAAAMRDKIAGVGLGSPWAFVAAGVFYSALHSLLEEYYWRWFVFRRLRRRVSFAAAAGVSSLAFMAHHVIVLDLYFGEQRLATAALSLAVAVGGWFWAWLYERTGSLLAPWISHAIVDAAIFSVGFAIAFG